MRVRQNRFNPKSRFTDRTKEKMAALRSLAAKISYGGNPEHKKHPGDFGLTPPSDPRRGKSLCDDVEIFKRSEAIYLLKQGLEKGMVSDREQNGWPKNIWSVTSQGKPLEAQLENPLIGAYHGYPVPESDPMFSEIIVQWNK
jgi:hypothetical protein